MPRRSTQDLLVIQKQTLIELVIEGHMKVKDASKILSIHPKSFSRMKRGYHEHGVAFLMPKKPGPKKGKTIVHNRTPKETEDIVLTPAQKIATTYMDSISNHYQQRVNRG